MEVLVFLTLSVFAICISGCNSVENEEDVAASSTTSKSAEEEVVVEEQSMVKIEKRSVRSIGKRTAWTLDDIDSVGGAEFSDTTKNNPLHEFLSEYEHATP